MTDKVTHLPTLQVRRDRQQGSGVVLPSPGPVPARPLAVPWLFLGPRRALRAQLWRQPSLHTGDFAPGLPGLHSPAESLASRSVCRW